MPKSTMLVLLPSPPSDITQNRITAAYRPSLTKIISDLKKASAGTRLLLAVDWPELYGRLQVPRAELYDDAQKVLGHLYVLVYMICGTLDLEVDSDIPESIDPCIIMLDCSGPNFIIPQGKTESIFGPFLHLNSLVNASDKFQSILSTNDDEGKKLLAKYHHLKQHEVFSRNFNAPEISSASDGYESPSFRISSATTHSVVAVGGTFDHLHAGHKLLLTATALLLQSSTWAPTNLRLIVGITGDELLKNKSYAEYIKSWKQRKTDVVDFLLSILLFTSKIQKDELSISSLDKYDSGSCTVHVKVQTHSVTIECIELKDPFGPAVTDDSITALVVSHETSLGGKAINQKRIERGVRPLMVYEIGVLSADESQGDLVNDFISKISSSQIRKRKAEIGYPKTT
ncbi:Phosphopantetheine adenylyltransferase 1 [Golovinomyces cichoracearum]|uniref:Phosphopantetheine adenylyltransferase 1 n=1 Tax=Golovinomyces cichoracearum TaxID=62708 RepID=A0A420J9X4_9PEZI|nr:Phosphopantetheine adenylyltransferase 1 [Golovinomyces cichoracearum]